MAANVKTKAKVALGIICFVVIMAIVSIIVAVAIAGMTRPVLYDKKFNGITNTASKEFAMIDGVFAANYNGDYVLTDGNNIVSKKYRHIRYWKDNLYLARQSKDVFAVVNTSGREVKTFNYSDRPLFQINDEIYPYYIVTNGMRQSIRSTKDKDFELTFDEIQTIGEVIYTNVFADEIYRQKGFFIYNQGGERILTSVENPQMKLKLESGQEIEFHGACIEFSDVDSNKYKFYSLEDFSILGEGQIQYGHIISGSKELYVKSGYFAAVTVGITTTVVEIPQLNVNFTFEGFFNDPINHIIPYGGGAKVIVHDGRNSLLYSKDTDSLATITRTDSVTFMDKKFILLHIDGETRMLALNGEAQFVGKSDMQILTIMSINENFQRQYVADGSELFKYGENSAGNMDFISLTGNFVSTDGYYINCTDGIYDYRFNKLNSFEGTTKLINDKLSYSVAKDGKQIFTDLGSGKTAIFDKGVCVRGFKEFVNYKFEKYVIYFKIYATDAFTEIIDLRDFNLKPMIDLNDKRLETTPLSKIVDVKFFEDGEYAIYFNDYETYLSYTGEFFEYGKYSAPSIYRNSNIVLNGNGRVITVVKDGELVIYKAAMGSFKEKNRIFFNGSVYTDAAYQNMTVFEDTNYNRKGLIDEYGNISIPAIYTELNVGPEYITATVHDKIFMLSSSGKVLYEDIMLNEAEINIEDYQYFLTYRNELGKTVMVMPDGKVISKNISSVKFAVQFKWVEGEGLASVDKIDFIYSALTIDGNIQIMKFPHK